MILLDTHIWVPWTAGDHDKLSPAAIKAIEEADRVGVSLISCWEVAMLVAKNRLRLSMDIEVWIQAALNLPRTVLIPLDVNTIVLSTRLPGEFHGDPADRMICATAMNQNITLITRDKAIRQWKHVKTIS